MQSSDGNNTQPLYLVVADGRPEFEHAFRCAAHFARARNARVAILMIQPPPDFQDWSAVENQQRLELRRKAERELQEALVKVQDLCLAHPYPCLYVEEGESEAAITAVIDAEPGIAGLILAAGGDGNDPGPLVSLFTRKGLAKLKVPLMLVSGHLDPVRLASGF